MPEAHVVESECTVIRRPEIDLRRRVHGLPRRQPRYQVLLWDDDDHSYEYVVRMMAELFGHSRDQGLRIARCVDREGRAVCLTTTREHAELKRQQIHAFGRDRLIASCVGSMLSTIEPLMA